MSRPIRRVVLLQNQLGDLGGVSRFCDALSRGLLARGYAVEIGAAEPAAGATMRYAADVPTWTLAPQLPPGAATDGLPGGRRRRELPGALHRFRRRVESAAAERFAGYDDDTVVIVTQLYARERVGEALAPERRRCAEVVQYHNSYSAAARSRDLARAREAYTAADAFLVLTQADAALFREAGFNNMGHIVNPVTVPVAPEADLEDGVVVSLGRYDRQKSLDHLIRAWSALDDDVTRGWRLELYGEGPERSLLEELIDDLGLRGTVRLNGPTAQAHDVLARAAVSAQSSQFEGLPLALMEASALGVPSVAYDCSPGIREIVVDGVTGLTVPLNNLERLADGLATLMASREVRLAYGRNAHRRMQSEFSLDSVLDAWERLFSELVR
ncbi:glycosyl transferase group 1 [Beutenbergia cavernae DSM 12333]|uniref:Glycosyl transferase group 1 n=1 Tax=Beutenbergia cavernae (strain ATCC BAA-8 / DSM 12333 / CCUG 43141 / JCM 11478 / NBRC 16432 / NCIMB 13614 / HKI 0122) TaxID=471853 RepID=C5C156_BEUC1|nr:glycosyltransferase [Beutenbergia cavernae]ACQ79460.1 glycosyl transferase group 1 [Beutenbergia cavernae DSM 12333]